MTRTSAVSLVREGQARVPVPLARTRRLGSSTKTIVGQSKAKLIRVRVRADSPLELAGLEAIVRAGTLLELADAAAPADVLLERISGFADMERDSANASSASEAEVMPRVVLAGEAELASLAAAALGGESAIRGVLPAWAGEEEIRAAIAAAAAGLLVIHPEASGFAAEALETRGARASLSENGRVPVEDGLRGQALSPRESEILNLLAAGLANKEVAFRLGISEHTVKFHVTSIFTKLNVTTRAAAVAVGIRSGIVAL